MGTQMHSCSNLYKYFKYTRYQADLESKLECIEGRLQEIDGYLERYKSNSILTESLVASYSKYEQQRLQLKLAISLINTKLACFEYASFLED